MAKNMVLVFYYLIFSMFFVVLMACSVNAAEKFDPVSSSFRMLWGLLVVLAVIFVLYFLLRKRVTAFNQNDKGLIKIVEIKHVMPKKTLMLIEVKGKEYLVGAGNDAINTIVPLHQSSTFSDIFEKTEEKLQP